MWLDWIREHKELLFWIGVGSLVLFVATLIVIPIIVTRIDEDYFMPDRKRAYADVHPILRAVGIVLKNVIGFALVLLGIVLTLPFVFGQGLLTILTGIVLMDFPGKRKFELWLVRKGLVHKSINWMRAKANRPPLKLPKEDSVKSIPS